jgi:hypothetical protein
LFASFRYQAKTWTRPRRVVANVEWHLGELFRQILERIRRLEPIPDTG